MFVFRAVSALQCALCTSVSYKSPHKHAESLLGAKCSTHSVKKQKKRVGSEFSDLSQKTQEEGPGSTSLLSSDSCNTEGCTADGSRETGSLQACQRPPEKAL